MGSAITEAMVKLGYAVVILSRNANSEQNKEKFDALDTEDKLAIDCDISDTEQVLSARDTVLKTFGNVDALINAAGWSTPVAHSNFDSMTEALFDKVVTINLRGTFTVAKTFIPYLKDNSAIVNITSGAASRRGGTNIAYAAAKAGVESLTRNLAVTLAPRTRVVGIAPGYVDNPRHLPETKEQALIATPMKRVATPEDIADAVVFAVTSKYVTGTIITIDGGRGA